MAKMLKILCRAQNVVYNVVSISEYELVGKLQMMMCQTWTADSKLCKEAK